jgi:CheY-like chemotaxis protein
MPLIALSGWGQKHDKRRALEAGFDHHLTKPVEAAALETLLALVSPAQRQLASGSAGSIAVTFFRPAQSPADWAVARR